MCLPTQPDRLPTEQLRLRSPDQMTQDIRAIHGLHGQLPLDDREVQEISRINTRVTMMIAGACIVGGVAQVRARVEVQKAERRRRAWER